MFCCQNKWHDSFVNDIYLEVEMIWEKFVFYCKVKIILYIIITKIVHKRCDLGINFTTVNDHNTHKAILRVLSACHHEEFLGSPMSSC